MKRTVIYNLTLVCLLIGCSLLGYGIGKLFDRTCEGIAIGLGFGLLLTAITLYKTYQKLLAFNKEKS